MREEQESESDREFMRKHGFHVAGKSSLGKERKTNRRRRQGEKDMTFSDKLDYYESLHNQDEERC